MRGTPWPEEAVQILTELYPNTRSEDVAKKVKRPLGSVYRKAAALGLTKTKGFLASAESGILRKGENRPESVATQFKPGIIPHNKGLRRPGYAPGRMKETQFKKGDRTGKAALNWKPVGTILADPQGYLRIKVREAIHGKEATGFGNTKVWPLLARHNWEQKHGEPIPEGMVLVFKDKDRNNCGPDNLELIDRKELMRRNSLWTTMPRELAEVVQLRGALNRKINHLTKEEKDSHARP